MDFISLYCITAIMYSKSERKSCKKVLTLAEMYYIIITRIAEMQYRNAGKEGLE
jgi:hypothetical protein